MSAEAGEITAEQIVVLDDLWHVVARQIREQFVLQGFTGQVMLNFKFGRVNDYHSNRVHKPEEEERRRERRAAPRDGEDRRRPG